MRLIVTRPEPDAASLASRLEAMGHQAIVAPLLRIVPRTSAIIPDHVYQAVAITSANAARALAHQTFPDTLLACHALTVGPQSLAAARAAGFASAESAGDDVARLADHIAATRKPENGSILYLSGAETAGDLEGSLKLHGFGVDRVVLYDAVPADRLEIDVAQADGVLLFSPRSARIWTQVAGEAAARLAHYCLSRNVADALPAGWRRRVAAAPDEASLLALLDRP